MKTAEEILKETLPSFGAEWIKDMKPELYDGIIEAMEEYRSQLTESKELPGYEQCDEIAFRRLLLTNRDSESELQDRMLVVDGLQMMRSIASPLLASKDARIKELEEDLRLMNFEEDDSHLYDDENDHFVQCDDCKQPDACYDFGCYKDESTSLKI